MTTAETWTTKDGRTMLVSEMTTQHLYNAYGYLIRRAIYHYGRKEAPNLTTCWLLMCKLSREFERRNLSYDKASLTQIAVYEDELNPDYGDYDEWGHAPIDADDMRSMGLK